MVKYYFDKYRVNQTTRYIGRSVDGATSSFNFNSTHLVVSSDDGVFVNSSTGKYLLMNGVEIGSLSVGSTAYTAMSNDKFRLDIQAKNAATVSGQRKLIESIVSETVNNLGSYIETIVAEEGTYPTNGIKNGHWYIKKELANTVPNIRLAIKSSELFEGSQVDIKGTASDIDSGDVVTVKYKVNNSSIRNIKAYVSQGTEEAFSKVLIYKNGSLYDGSTLVIANLIDGNHTITVWAEDNNGGKTEEHKITIITKRNRPPELIITDYPQDLQGLITTDKLTVTGTATDPDEGAKLIITAQVNNDEPKTIPMEDGEWSFSFAVKQLNEGDNTLTFQVADQYGATNTKQIKLTNSIHASPAPVSIARYQLHPPEPITDIILWIKHKADDDIQVYASFVEEGQADNFVLLQKTVGMSPTGVVESEFIYHSDVPSKKPKIKLVNAQAALMLMGGMSNESKAPTT